MNISQFISNSFNIISDFSKQSINLFSLVIEVSFSLFFRDIIILLWWLYGRDLIVNNIIIIRNIYLFNLVTLVCVIFSIVRDSISIINFPILDYSIFPFKTFFAFVAVFNNMIYATTFMASFITFMGPM